MDYKASNKNEHRKVCISMPLLGGKDPSVNEADGGEWQYIARQSVLEWIVDPIDNGNSTRTLESAVPAADLDDLFPGDVPFSAACLICEVDERRVHRRYRSGSELIFADAWPVILDKETAIGEGEFECR